MTRIAGATLLAPFPYFGGKRSIAADVWQRLGTPTQYIEPFCGSAAMLLAAPQAARLEVVCDASGFIANFWRAVKRQPAAVAAAADYPVSHVDLGARHIWLMAQRDRLAAELHDAHWPGDALVAGWWLWGQCSWIGSGWCDWTRAGKVPHAGNAGMGVQALGKVPRGADAGMGVQALGKVPRGADAGAKIQSAANNARFGDRDSATAHLLTSSGRTAWVWLHRLADRLERVRVVHGDWTRCVNSHYGKSNTAIFLDPPYRAFERLYGTGAPVADAVAEWAYEHGHQRVALCGHAGDYDLPGWDVMAWSRRRLTYGSAKTKDAECVWFSPGCLPARDAKAAA